MAAGGLHPPACTWEIAMMEKGRKVLFWISLIIYITGLLFFLLSTQENLGHFFTGINPQKLVFILYHSVIICLLVAVKLNLTTSSKNKWFYAASVIFILLQIYAFAVKLNTAQVMFNNQFSDMKPSIIYMLIGWNGLVVDLVFLILISMPLIKVEYKTYKKVLFILMLIQLVFCLYGVSGLYGELLRVFVGFNPRVILFLLVNLYLLSFLVVSSLKKTANLTCHIVLHLSVFLGLQILGAVLSTVEPLLLIDPDAAKTTLFSVLMNPNGVVPNIVFLFSLVQLKLRQE